MPLHRVLHRPALTAPVLVVSMEGWIDAGLGAAVATATLLAGTDTEVVATFDNDELIDQRARRPVMHIVNGVNTGLTWPEIELRAGRDQVGNELLLLTGPEPDFRWRAFADDVVALAVDLGARMAVDLGAFPAPWPHTRAVILASTSTTDELAGAIGYTPGAFDVPAGVHAALERAFHVAGIPAAGLWARVPHYASAMPYPAASAALLDGLSALTGITVDASSLRESAIASVARLDELIGESEEHTALVRSLEAQVDANPSAAGGIGPLPTGDELAAELEQFLRDQRSP